MDVQNDGEDDDAGAASGPARQHHQPRRAEPADQTARHHNKLYKDCNVFISGAMVAWSKLRTSFVKINAW